jgi:N-acetylglucosaminyldiphosphoundecaprenol N-acetyl-beta-D-mannosaminyltransferase
MISVNEGRIATRTGPYMILGMRLDELEPSRILDAVMERAHLSRPGYCCVTNVHQCMLVHDEPDFAKIVNGASLVVTDSRVLHRFVMRRFGLPNQSTIRGAELMTELCGRAAKEGVSVALVGGRDDAMLAELSAALRRDYPGLEVAYAFSPPFGGMSPGETDAMITKLRASCARLVFVGLGCPKQERWMGQHSPRLNAMLIGVGAAFDFNAGTVRKSPPWVHAAGLEWAYRLLAEPRRLWRRYLIQSPRFLLAYWREGQTRRA